MKKNKLKLYAIMIFVLLCTEVHCQKVAIKSNLLYDVTATVNAGIEVGLAPKWTFDLSANYNGWTFSHERKWKHWLLQPEGRYWFCDRFAGHFVGVHALGGQYNIGNLNNHISFLGTDLSVLSRLVCRWWYCLWLCVDIEQTLEFGSGVRSGLDLYSLRQLSLYPMRYKNSRWKIA